MKKKRIQSVAILGGGPSGAALACHLLRLGRQVVLLDDEAKPDLIVGESLVPAVLPMLDRLGLRERVKAIGEHKPGVTFTFDEKNGISFNFQAVKRCGLPPFAFNVPRPAFDRVLSQRARELGVPWVSMRAKLVRSGENSVELAADTLAQIPMLDGRQPDLIVDATGRARTIARMLDIPARVGPRNDVAHFAHYRGFAEENPKGQVVISRLKSGWSWRIPLQDRMSVGVVMNREEAASLGHSPEEKLEAAIARDPLLEMEGKARERISRVMTYSNYQLISERSHGPGWVLLGDAFGFVDPMLSPGLMLALCSAEILAQHLDEPEKYEQKMKQWLEAWQELIGYFYDGRMFAMYQTGMDIERRHPGVVTRFMHTHMERNVACMASGAKTLSRYSRNLLKFMSKYGIWMADPAKLAIA